MTATHLVDATGLVHRFAEPPARIVSLVPSVSETLHRLGVVDRLVGVTDFCVLPEGGFRTAQRVRGTKNPDVEAIVDLAPDLVVANIEENRERHVTALREAGLEVLVTYPRSVAGAGELVRELGMILHVPDAAGAVVADISGAVRDARRRCVGRRSITVLCPVWRDPWMAVGPATYAADLLATCGFDVRPHSDEHYPTVEVDSLRGSVAVVLLPSEPFPFAAEHLEDFAGWDADVRLVDGSLLTWHGARTADGARYFADLAEELDADGVSGRQLP